MRALTELFVLVKAFGYVVSAFGNIMHPRHHFRESLLSCVENDELLFLTVGRHPTAQVHGKIDWRPQLFSLNRAP